MLQAEKNVVNKPIQSFAESEQNTASGLFAVLPIVVFISAVLIAIVVTGEGDSISDILATTNSFYALLIGSFLGSITAIFLSVSGRLLSFRGAIDSWSSGVNSVIGAVIILVLSWSLAQISKELQASSYLVSVLGSVTPVELFPASVFIVAALIALGTGTA